MEYTGARENDLTTLAVAFHRGPVQDSQPLLGRGHVRLRGRAVTDREVIDHDEITRSSRGP